MPSWLVASMSVACSIAHSAVLRAREPFSASGSICERRAEMTANSAPTKKAFAMSSTTSQAIPAQSLIGCPRPASAPVGIGFGREPTRSMRRPSRRSTASVPSSMSTSSPTTGRRPSSLITKPATVSYVPSSGTRMPVRSSSSSGRSMPGKIERAPADRTMPGAARSCSSAPRRRAPRRGPRASRRRRCRRTRRRRRPSGSRGRAARPSSVSSCIGLGHAQRLGLQRGARDTSPARSRGTADGLLDVHDADDVVDRLVDDREPRVARLRGRARSRPAPSPCAASARTRGRGVITSDAVWLGERQACGRAGWPCPLRARPRSPSGARGWRAPRPSVRRTAPPSARRRPCGGSRSRCRSARRSPGGTPGERRPGTG